MLLLNRCHNRYNRALQKLHKEEWAYHHRKPKRQKSFSNCQSEFWKLSKISLSKMAFCLGDQRLFLEGPGDQPNTSILQVARSNHFNTDWRVTEISVLKPSARYSCQILHKSFGEANISSHHLSHTCSSNYNSQIVSECSSLPRDVQNITTEEIFLLQSCDKLFSRQTLRFPCYKTSAT